MGQNTCKRERENEGCPCDPHAKQKVKDIFEALDAIKNCHVRDTDAESTGCGCACKNRAEKVEKLLLELFKMCPESDKCPRMSMVI